MGVASGGPRFRNLSKIAKKCFWGGQFGCLACWGGGGGGICIGTNLDDEQTLLITA